MTTRRSRLQIRPNTGVQNIRETNDNTTRKINAVNKCTVKKNNGNSNNELERNVGTTNSLQILDGIKKSIESPSKEKEQKLVPLQKEPDVTDKSKLELTKENFIESVPKEQKRTLQTDDEFILKSEEFIKEKVADNNINQENEISKSHNDILNNEISNDSIQNKNKKIINEDCGNKHSENLKFNNDLNNTFNKDVHSKETVNITKNNDDVDNNVIKKSSEKGVGRRRLVRAQPNIREAGQRNNRQRKLSVNEVSSEKNKSVKSKEHVPNVEKTPLENESICSPSKVVVSTTNSKQQIQPFGSSHGILEKKTLNKTNDVEEISKKRNRYNKKPPERSKMTMMDLIYWNPPNNPMSQKKEKKETDSVTILQPMEEEEEIDDPQDNSTNENLEKQEQEKQPSIEDSLPGPRVMIGPNGEITIDEDSLVIKRSNNKQNTLTDVIQEVSECTYSSFRKHRPKHFWSDKETTKFYKALNVVGTDFSLMQNLFPNRSRQELKNKFKREERLNRKLVDIAIKNPQQFDLTGFDDDDHDDEDNDDFIIEKEKSKKKNSVKESNQRVTTRKRRQNKNRNENSSKISVSNDDDDTFVNEEASTSCKKRKELNTQEENFQCKSKENTEENLSDVTDSNTIAANKTFDDSEVIKSRLVENSTIFNEISKETTINTFTQEEQSRSPENKNIPDNSEESLVTLNNSEMSCLSPGQIVLLPGKTTDQEQVLHVYVVSPPHQICSTNNQLSRLSLKTDSPIISCDLSDNETQIKKL